MAFGFDDFAVAVGLTGLAKEVLGPLLKSSLEDYTKDFFKGCIEDVAGLAEQEPVQKAMGKALKAFVELMSAELEYAGLTGVEIRDFYQPALRAYMKDADVKATLGAAFEPDCKAINHEQLQARWTELDLRELPNDFDWEQISKQYVRKVKGIWRESPELRELLTLHNQEAIRQGVKSLVGIEPDSASWEYFVAWTFVFKLEKVKEISFHELLEQTFVAHWQDEHWHKVLRLISGMLKPQHVEKIIEFLLTQNIRNEPSNVFLAADCLAGIRQRSELNEIAERVWNSVEALVQFDLDYYYKWHEEEKRIIDIRTKAVTTISSTWTESPRTIAWLKACAQFDDNYYVRIAAVQELARNFKDDPDILPILRNYAQSDKDYFVRRAAIQELAQSFKDDPDTLLLLKTCIRSEEDPYVREAAVDELAKGFNDNPDIMPLLKELIQSNEDLSTNKDITICRTVRSVALKGLVCFFKDDPDTLPILKKRAKHDEDLAVRREALQQLTQWFKDDPDTLPILKKRAKYDRDNFVKEIALEKLAQCFKDDPDTLSTLKKRAQFASNFYVRYVALRELVQVFKDDPDTLPILKKQIQSEHTPDHSRSLMIYLLSKHFKDDPDTLIFLKLYAQSEEYKYLRQTALEELSKGFKDDPDTLNILKKRAELDKDIHVQETAVRELTRSLKDHPDTLHLLKLLAQSENASTRCIAVQALTIHYKDEPNVLSLLKERAELDKFYLVRNAAMKTLARGLKDDLGLYELLHNCVYHDPYKPRDSLIFRRRFYYRPLDYNPRFHALKALVQQFPCHPKTYELLTDRTQHDNDKYLRSWASEHLAKINLDK